MAKWINLYLGPYAGMAPIEKPNPVFSPSFLSAFVCKEPGFASLAGDLAPLSDCCHLSPMFSAHLDPGDGRIGGGGTLALTGLTANTDATMQLVIMVNCNC